MTYVNQYAFKPIYLEHLLSLTLVFAVLGVCLPISIGVSTFCFLGKAKIYVFWIVDRVREWDSWVFLLRVLKIG